MSDIHIYSHKRSSNFTIVPNHIINADYLKLEDKAFLIWVLSKPEDWQLNTLSLAKIHQVSKDKITAISKRLQNENHLYIKKHKNGHAEWFIFENVDDCIEHKSTCPRTSPRTCPRTSMDIAATPDIKPYPENQSDPHPEKPDQENQDVLIRTDLLPRTELKDLSPSHDVQKSSAFDENFEILWETWPNTKQRKRAITSLKAVLSKEKIKSPDSIKEFIKRLKSDIQERLRLTEGMFDDGFRNTMLSTYINNIGWMEPMPEKPVNIAHTDEAKAANANKAKSLLAQYGYSK